MESEEIKELKALLRHLHNDVENIKRKQEVLEHKITNVAFLVYGCYKQEADEKGVDQAVNLDPECYSNLDELYSPIDNKDKQDWEDHLKKEKG